MYREPSRCCPSEGDKEVGVRGSASPVALLSFATLAALPAAASAAPRLTLTTTTWTSPAGGCSQVIQHAEVEGVSGDAKTIIDRDLTQAMIDNQLPKLYTSKDDMARRCAGSERAVSMGQVWSTGLASDRWLSVRLRQFVRKPSTGADLETYFCMTFDLKSADGPLPTEHFYTAATRPAFNSAIAAYYGKSLDSARRSFYLGLNVANTEILVTETGAEVTEINDDAKHENDVVKLSNASLRGAYAPNGPLDPATR